MLRISFVIESKISIFTTVQEKLVCYTKSTFAAEMFHLGFDIEISVKIFILIKEFNIQAEKILLWNHSYMLFLLSGFFRPPGSDFQKYKKCKKAGLIVGLYILWIF